MKKILMIILLLILSFNLTGCGANDPFASPPRLEIALDTSEKTVEVGDIIRFKTNVNRLAVEGELVWESSVPEIASVDNGVVVALMPGETIITATVGEYTTTVKLTVIEKDLTYAVQITGVQTVIVGHDITLTASTLPASTASFIWSTSNQNVATVNQSGIVTAVGLGLTTITAKLTTNPSLSADYVIYVRNPEGIKDVVINEVTHYTYQTTGEIDLMFINQVVTNIANSTKYAVVGVSNYQMFESNLVRSGIGSGVIYQKEELTGGNYKYTLLTNHHVIEDFVEVRIELGYWDLEVSATVVRHNSEVDLAIVTFISDIDITPVDFGTKDSVKTGNFVIAIGNPTGYTYFGSVTFGMISFAERTLRNESALYVQHDAAINPGNSGGPLLDMNGKIIGINTLKLASYDIDNMGFAIALETIEAFLNG